MSHLLLSPPSGVKFKVLQQLRLSLKSNLGKLLFFIPLQVYSLKYNNNYENYNHIHNHTCILRSDALEGERNDSCPPSKILSYVKSVVEVFAQLGGLY